MLKRLVIQNYALIENLDIEFPDGLVIVTGETGAGKSIMLGALSLLLGAKGDVSSLKDSSRNCVVEGEFESDGEEIILRRVITPAGRTRNFINDEPATLAALTAISSRIVDIHAQHQHLLLGDSLYQMKVLDHFAGSGKALEEYRRCYAALQDASLRLKEVEAKIARQESERDYMMFQLEKLQQAKLKEGELEELEAEQAQLANAGEIKENIYAALEAMQPMGVPIVQKLKEAVHLLQKSSNFVPDLEQLCNRLESCRIECRDIEQELEGLAEATVVSPHRLEQVEERLSDIYSLMKKHAAADVSELLCRQRELESSLAESDNDDMLKEQLLKEVAQLEQLREELAAALTGTREAKVKELGSTLQQMIRDLQMPYAVFEVSLTSSDKFTPMGKDNIEFLFCANGNAKTVPLQKVASGGELSRIMLCLKALMARYAGMPTMIFDEIDTGVSGSIADKMGELIGKMGESMQIFAITHLPQIASKRGTHLLVYKEFDGQNNATTHIKAIDGQERVNEVARMLSGAELTNAALENARELLKHA